MVKLPETISSKKPNFPSPRSNQHSIASQLVVGTYEPISLYTWILIGLILWGYPWLLWAHEISSFVISRRHCFTLLSFQILHSFCILFHDVPWWWGTEPGKVEGGNMSVNRNISIAAWQQALFLQDNSSSTFPAGVFYLLSHGDFDLVNNTRHGFSPVKQASILL